MGSADGDGGEPREADEAVQVAAKENSKEDGAEAARDDGDKEGETDTALNQGEGASDAAGTGKAGDIEDGGEPSGDGDAGNDAGGVEKETAGEDDDTEKKKRKKKKKKAAASDEDDDDYDENPKKKKKKDKHDSKLSRLARGEKSTDEKKKAKKKKSKTAEEGDTPVKKGTAKRVSRKRAASDAAEEGAARGPQLDDDDERVGAGGAGKSQANDDEDMNDLPEDDEGFLIPEAIEDDDEIEALFGKKGKKKNVVDQAAVNKAAQEMVLEMENAASADMNAVGRKDIPVRKLKMLRDVEEFLSKTQNHEALLENNALSALRLWLQPLPDRSLPNLKVRSMVLKALMMMPIDTSLPDRRDQLKKSELGRYVKFYSVLEDETPENRRVALKLVEKWSRPIYNIQQNFGAGDPDAHQPAPEDEDEVRRSKKRKAYKAAAAELDDPGAGAGGANVRKRALPPDMANMDYQVPPASRVDTEAIPEKDKAKMQEQRGGLRLLEKIGKIPSGGGRKKVANVKVSVEGRGLVIKDTNGT